MRVPRSACVICNNFGRPTKNGTRERRTVSTKARPNNTFNASKLVLDLDAADSKYVRKYDESKDRRATNYSPVAMKLPFEREADRSKAKKMKLHQLFSGPADIYAATSADYFSLALMDQTKTLWGPRKSLLGVLFRNRVPVAWHTEFTKGNIMPVVDLLSEIAPDPSQYELQKALDTIRHCNTMLVLKRATSFLAQTREGCRLLASNGPIIVDAIRECRRSNARLSKPGAVLTYISNLTTKLNTIGVDIGPSICDIGIYYASKTPDLPAVKRFLDLAVIRQHPTLVTPAHRHHSHRHSAVLHLVSDVQFSNLARTEKDFGRRAEATLRLLTGWDAAGVPGENEERKPSFANFAVESSDMYGAYLVGLGEMGAAEALWHEWINPYLTPAPASLNSMDRAVAFANALDCAQGQLKAIGESKDMAKTENVHLSRLQQALRHQLSEGSHDELQKAISKSVAATSLNILVDKLINLE